MLLHLTENITYQTARDSNTRCDSRLDLLLQFKSRKVHNKLLKRVLKLKIYLSPLSEEMILATCFNHWVLQWESDPIAWSKQCSWWPKKVGFSCLHPNESHGLYFPAGRCHNYTIISPAEAAKSSCEFRWQ